MLYKIINTYADESDFILNLIDDHPYIGWYMLLRLGESDTTKAIVKRKNAGQEVFLRVRVLSAYSLS